MKNFSVLYCFFLFCGQIFASDKLKDFSTYEDLTSFIKGNNIKSIDELLDKMPPNYSRNFTAMFKSNSLQSASWKNPRIIMTGPTASLTVALSTDPRDPHYNSLETMEFNEKENRFVLREIKFTSEGVAYSEANPKRCLSCHGVDPAPIWEEYDFWPGAIRGEDDGRGTDEEEQKLKELLMIAAQKKGRFARIPDVEKSYQLHLFDPGGEGAKKLDRSYKFHNAQMTERLFYQNSKRIARIIRNGEEYDRYKFLVVGAFYSCERMIDLKDFYPEGFSPQFVSQGNGLYILEHLPPTKKNWKSWDTTNFKSEIKKIEDLSLNTGVGNTEEIIYNLVKEDKDLKGFIKFNQVDVAKIYRERAYMRNFEIADRPLKNEPQAMLGSYLPSKEGPPLTDKEEIEDVEKTKALCLKLATLSRQALAKNSTIPKDDLHAKGSKHEADDQKK